MLTLGARHSKTGANDRLGLNGLCCSGSAASLMLPEIKLSPGKSTDLHSGNSTPEVSVVAWLLSFPNSSWSPGPGSQPSPPPGGSQAGRIVVSSP